MKVQIVADVCKVDPVGLVAMVPGCVPRGVCSQQNEGTSPRWISLLGQAFGKLKHEFASKLAHNCVKFKM